MTAPPEPDGAAWTLGATVDSPGSGAVADRAVVLDAWVEAMPDPQVLLECVRDSRGRVVDFDYRDLNPAACGQLRLVRAEARGLRVSQVVPGIVPSGLLGRYAQCLATGDPLAIDDQAFVLFDEPRRYDIRGARVSADLLAVSWRDVTERFELVRRVAESEEQLETARRRQEAADALYRRSVESAAVGMGLVSLEGRFVEVNDALCVFFGYDAEALIGKTWQELTAEDDVASSAAAVDGILSGWVDSYRTTKRYLHADGSVIWADLSVGCVRAEDGQVEILIAQIVDITDEVATREQLAVEQARNQALARQLTSEIRSAADYVVSTLPRDDFGPIPLSSRYLPALDLGGDSFNYLWLDDDHLAIYLIDVSGHGVRPALLSMSVHNLVRSGTLPTRVLLKPDRLLAKLNGLFRMDDQDGHYFTIWYGVYEVSTATLRYASAGHPPALAFVPAARDDWRCVALSTNCLPVGMFDDTVFESDVCSFPDGCHLLLFSDGAFEFGLPEGGLATLDEFTDLAHRLLRSGRLSIDAFVDELRARTSDGRFNDDCSLITATFPGGPSPRM